jgi:hypothetical protein
VREGSDEYYENALSGTVLPRLHDGLLIVISNFTDAIECTL